MRLSLLEAELRTLKEENRGLRERLDRAEQGLHNATLSFEQQLSSARLDEQEMAENLTHYIQGRVHWACLSMLLLLFLLLSSL